MVTIEDLTRPIGRAFNYYRDHPGIFHTVNTALIYLGAHGLSVLTHNSGNHDLERLIDAGNIAATGGYAYYAVNRLLPASLRGDVIKTAIIGLMAYAGLEEARQYMHNYDASTMYQKILEGMPFVWRTDQAGDLLKGLMASGSYFGIRALRGLVQGARRPHHI